ncbi:MAG: histidine--tRNA ligase [Bacteroides sp.]
MAKIQVATPKGVRDFSPHEVRERELILRVLKRNFENFGFLPLETAAMESLAVLQGKYGDEGDRLLFRILNSGDYLKGVEGDLRELSRTELTNAICEKGLRYDLTVPMARYVATHWQELPHPFKRFQIQPVWRADRPQKGRFREFVQCDVDIVGSNSRHNEEELLDLVSMVFYDLQLPVEVQINSRKILEDIAARMGHPELLVPMTVALDKLDKVGKEAVAQELVALGFEQEDVKILLEICKSESSLEKQVALQRWINTEEYISHVAEIMQILLYKQFGEIASLSEEDKPKLANLYDDISNGVLRPDSAYWMPEFSVHFVPTLARGLSYYTGTIFEVKGKGVNMGSICGGGRYDNLTGIFGLEGISGVGISFGLERIYEILKELDCFEIYGAVDVMLATEDDNMIEVLMFAATNLRDANFKTLVPYEPMKRKKQLEYANKNKIPWVATRNKPTEKYHMRNMVDGKEYELFPNELVNFLQDWRTKEHNM